MEIGVISIRYNIKELRWIRRDSKGDYFFRPHDAKDVGIESWRIYLSKDDVVREILKNEMVRRKNLFLGALKNSDASILPRLPEKMRKKKCSHCPFYDRCMNQDQESEEAKKMASEIDLLDIRGIVNSLD
jgi:hypothetical protein